MQLDWGHELILSWTIQFFFIHTASVTIQDCLSVLYRNPGRDPDKQQKKKKKKTFNRKKPRTGQAYFGATLLLMAGWGGEIEERIDMVNTYNIHCTPRGDMKNIVNINLYKERWIFPVYMRVTLIVTCDRMLGRI